MIKALNKDLPYDEFVRKQLAADFITDQPNDPDLAALGFLTAGPVFLNRRQLIIDDQIDLVTRGLMGFTVASCAMIISMILFPPMIIIHSMEFSMLPPNPGSSH